MCVNLVHRGISCIIYHFAIILSRKKASRQRLAMTCICLPTQKGQFRALFLMAHAMQIELCKGQQSAQQRINSFCNKRDTLVTRIRMIFSRSSTFEIAIKERAAHQ